MRNSVHATQRMRQRGLDPRVVDLIVNFGQCVPGSRDRLILTQRDLPWLVLEAAPGRRVLELAKKQLPAVCVVKDQTVVTAFRAVNRIGFEKGYK